MAYFLESTWFNDTFIDGGVVTRARFVTLVEAMTAICDCYEVDTDRLA